ncbi:MAG: conjugal transfer protein TraN [Betaproteobacteria bacterium]|nr:conjugal transfer protein TraN [Betaproteobacteria bacterium]
MNPFSSPRFLRAVAWLTTVSFVFAQHTAIAGPHEEGVAAGQAANPTIRANVNEPAASSIVPGYTATPPERNLYGQSDLSSQSDAALAACAATPTDPTCQGILGARDSANTPRPSINPYDPSVLDARRIAENPAATLEELSSFYGGCEVNLSATPATEIRRCHQSANTPDADACTPLIEAGCTLANTECRQTNLETNTCTLTEHQYSCPVPASQSATVSNCPANVFCFAGECFNTAYTNDADFARSMSFLEAAREAGMYLDTNTMRVFNGESAKCRKRLLKNCCHSDSSGAGMSNQSVSGTGSRLVFDILMDSGNRSFIWNGMTALVTGAGFSGTFTAYGVSIAVNGAAIPAGSTVIFSTQSMVIAVDPWSLVIAVIIYVIMEMSSCNKEEGKLAMREGAGLCHTIGTWCSSCLKLFGKCVSCIEHSTRKCCFNSKLSRLINEQGRAQIGKGWGTPEKPDCSGFTIEQLQRLDFSRMDLTEFYSSIVPTLPDAGAIQDSNRAQTPNCYYGEGRCN